ncbi:hypothetical protein TNCT_90061 [Trichonephila clavata]|uniref:Uncharacterized protein n=1 Tax=Trichonephila clavata TaxID=2740835 RepID=A0A8X6HX94_TRICU|nr:hypothetical protein TNCT_90061 [Trichonephila clavata]
MEHRNEAHTTTDNPSLRRNLPPAAGLPCPSAACDSALFRCCSKNFEVQNLSSSPPLAVVFTTRSSLRLRLDRLATFLRASRELCTNSPRRQGSRHRGPHETAPSSGGPRKISKSKTTPLPVLFFITCNFTSPFDCNSIVFPTRLARTVHKLPRRLGFRTPRPHATAPSSGGPRKISKSKNTPLPVLVFISLALPFDCNSIVLRLSYEPHTKSAQTSPDGRAPVPLGRMRQRPLPVLLEKFRSPKTLLLATTRCRRHHLICPSTATRSSRNLHTSLAPTPPAAGLPSPGPASHNALFRWTSKNFEVQNNSTSCSLLHHLQLHFTLRLQLDSLPYETRTNCAQTPPDGWASVPLGRMRQRPLPVDLEKFRSPKPLVLTTSCSVRAKSRLGDRFTPSLSPLPCTHSAPPLPTAGLPSPGPARDGALFRCCSKNFEVQNRSFSPLPVHHSLFDTSLAPTSPDGRAPVTGARSPQRPLPVDLVPDLSTSLSHQTRIFFFFPLLQATLQCF